MFIPQSDNQTPTPSPLYQSSFGAADQAAMQMFNDAQGEQGEGQTAVDVNATDTLNANSDTSNLTQDMAIPTQTQDTIVPQNTTVPPAANIPDKFKNVDDLVAAYKELERAHTQTRQDMAALSNNQPAQPPVDNSPIATQSDTTPVDNEQFLSSFYENPVQSIEQLITQVVSKAVAPITDRFQADDNRSLWTGRANKLVADNPDANQYGDDIMQILQDNPHLMQNENAYHNAYLMAKGKSSNNAQPMTAESLMAQPDFMEKYILNNPDIKGKILNSHMQAVKDQSAGVPNMLNGGGSNIAAPVEKAKSFGQASEMLLRSLNGGNQ